MLEIKNYMNLMNGEWRTSKEQISIFSPLDQQELGKIPAMTKDEIDEAMTAACVALQSWRETPIVNRTKILYKAAELLDERKDLIAKVLAKEIAKNFKSAVSEVVRTADLIRYTAEEGIRIHGDVMKGDTFEASSKNKLAIISHEPMGVVLAIAPFNYPINLAGSKIAPALIGGNVVIFKPPTQGAMSALLLAEVFHDAGLPKGVLNTVTGKGSVIGDYIISHPAVNFINFTGSTAVGKRIGELAGMTPLLLELGGKDAAIVLEDADLEKAANEIVQGAFNYSGQRCTAIKRVLVIDQVADQLVKLIQQKVESLKVGDPFDNADITPLINTQAADFVEELAQDAIKQGATVIVPIKREGNLIHPGVFDHVTLDMRIAWEEPFGPILPIIHVKDEREAIAINNKSEYGLQAAIFTQNTTKALELSSKLEVGTVHLNSKTQRGPDNFPFLGIKQSGVGVQGIRYSIESMTKIKSVVINI
ncbi:NADP-dependent glyceraldehyde-3-phosphate dehydrogenase [Clostridia bacterium]|nr:NADP-dependent glyceraldehyde-3-phosphate dehydrogenase [Clostridia bacterium]